MLAIDDRDEEATEDVTRRELIAGALGLLATAITGCGQPAATPTALAQASPTPTQPAPTGTATPLVATVLSGDGVDAPSRTPTLQPWQGAKLVILHTNDVGGQTDPCG
jgi:hypothetical protein